MARTPRIGDWPFSSEEEALLLWLRSPYRSHSRQWCVEACFRSDDGSIHELGVPWGALPQLALGLTYLDGYAVEEKAARGTLIDFEVPVGPQSATLPAHAVLPSDTLSRIIGSGGDERCLVFDVPGRRIVLPVLEAIRTLLCPNRALASGLLEPEYLSRIVAGHEVKEGVLHLAFAAEIAPAALDQVVARRVGRLLYDNSFRRCWDAVERGRFHAVGSAQLSRRVPLDCPLPDLDSRWVVRALPVGGADTWLVLEILSVSPAAELPFRRVIFTHPDLNRTEKTGSPTETGANGGVRGGKDDLTKRSAGPSSRPKKRLSIERSDRAPRDPRRPRRAGIIVSGLMGDHLIKVQKLAARIHIQPRERQKSSGATLSPVEKRIGQAVGEAATDKADPLLVTAIESTSVHKIDASEIPVSLSSAARDGSSPAGEYKAVELLPNSTTKPVELRPLPLICKPHDGLDRLATSLGHLAAMRPDWIIDWHLATLTIGIPYAHMGSQKRQYALVRCAGVGSTPPPACWLLEFARLDQHAPSTLLFFPGINDGSNAVIKNDEEVRRRVPRLVCEVLAASLKGTGWWDQVELMKFHHSGRMRFDLFAHHFSRDPLVWAKRLERRIGQVRRAVSE